MTPSEALAAVERLDREATPGPWCQHPNGTSVWTGDVYDCEVEQTHICSVGCKAAANEPERVVNDLDLIATFRTAAPILAARVRELEEDRDACKREVGRVIDVLRAYAAHTHLSHCGSCCRSPFSGAVIVTEESCVCHEEDRAVMRIFGMFDTADKARVASSALAAAKGDEP